MIFQNIGDFFAQLFWKTADLKTGEIIRNWYSKAFSQ